MSNQWQLPDPQEPFPQSVIPYNQPPLNLKHSGPGIASFILALFVGFLLFASILTAGILESRPGGMNEESPIAIALGLSICFGLLLAAIGGILGVIGVLISNRKKLFAILGLALNGLIFLVIIFLFVIGLLAK